VTIEGGNSVTPTIKCLALIPILSAAATAACCYFAALDKDVNQPGQRAFICWDEAAKMESFTVQPQFEGNAGDFGMVIPTPARPKLQEMPRDFFKELAIFTILEPMDINKYKRRIPVPSMSMDKMESASSGRPAVRVLEGGVVGSLDYKILEADKADALFQWLKSNRYHYAGDEATLEFYVKQKWNFTVMKIDPRQMKKQPDGKYLGDVTPTRFSFHAEKPIYPLRITRISVKDNTDVLLYVMSKTKMDMDGPWSYEGNFMSMWTQALSFAIPEKLTPEERRWQSILSQKAPQPGPQGAQLEWSGQLTQARLDVLTGKRAYNRDAPAEDIKKLKILSGHLKQGWYLTKFRKRFNKEEMTKDIALIPARCNGVKDDLEYVSILPTSPP
jgi:hypothetical protein